MKTIKLDVPKPPIDVSRIFDTTEPIIRLEQMGADEYERVVGEWAYSCLKETKNYYDVVLMGGSSDAGRDLVAYLDSSYKKFDIYQCKHYDAPLKPSEYWIEFGKLCYYTYIKEYNVPQNYYIVASKGLGTKMRWYIENSCEINSELIRNWDIYCGRKKQILADGIVLTQEMRSYIENFDFSIIKDISQIKFIEEFSQTGWYKYHFGGGIRKRTLPVKPPIELSNDEKRMPYIKQLFNVYSNEAKCIYSNEEELQNNLVLFNHFLRQREGFFSAQSLKRFVRDELINEDSYEDLKGQVSFGVMDTYEEKHCSELERVKKTTGKATEIKLVSEEIRDIRVQDKTGMCHELVNDGMIVWSDNNENL
ncbi:ABC-three component system protein [Lacrimispora sp.]|uniref:ABC-three component system protein n=1 Tax=Lacrimispora sp. TaxID=2719234 RepID=UPI0029E3B8E2|nr:hypothetical protein [Lacrimispora sp.]